MIRQFKAFIKVIKKEIILGVILFLVPLAALISIFLYIYYNFSSGIFVRRDLLAQIELQKDVEAQLLAELNTGEYDFESPLVASDPYGVSPLTALVLFTSEEPLNISIYIAGKTRLDDVNFTFEGYNTTHHIPVYGLYPGMLNIVELTARNESGETRSISLELQTDPLPPELAKNIILTGVDDEEKYQPGFNYTYVQKSAFDSSGEYRWFYGDFLTLQSTLYRRDGNMVFSKGTSHEGEVFIFEINPLGRILSVYSSNYGAHHDIEGTDTGNLLVTGSKGETIEDYIYEIDISTGEIVNSLDLKKILQRTRENGVVGFNTRDWFHNNAITYDNGSIIISGRSQSTVAKLKWPTGEIEWILSDHAGWSPVFDKYLLSPVGDGFKWQFAQHAPEVLPDFDNNPDTIDILLFDNGCDRFELDSSLKKSFTKGELEGEELYSRLVHYRIDEKAKTVEQIWQYGKERGYSLFSDWRGDADLMENGNRLGVFDRRVDKIIDYDTSFIEVNENSDVIWEAYSTSYGEVGEYPAYRLERLPAYSHGANNLHLGEPVRNLIRGGI